ncbi:MAG: NnrS family protein [Sulfuricaulis sp.]|uniref:NnrS family protein n=1 Tax=Sulfuricaulis sp. TaxID=2003553 RepID=UPI0025D9E5A2|nr:NnrS family protein [Sulfuricaulis sp.]MCR4346667.1 NnrS family protein [Sulfuricaulis sp.]
MSPDNTNHSASSRWDSFTAAPHRMMFLPGALQTVLIMLFWLAELLARAGWSEPLRLVLPSISAHVFLMLFGLFPYFIFGFLFTVYPRWMGGPVIAASRYVAVFFFLVTGMVLFYAGLFFSLLLVALALVLQLLGWALALHALFTVFRQAPKHGPHERLLNLALAAGAVGILCFLTGVLIQSPLAFTLAREIGLWLFLMPVVFLVAHRMIPFFTQSALINYLMVRPAWTPPLMVVCVVAHAAFELAGLPAWRFLADAPLAAAALHHSWLWQFRRSFHARLLAMLHIAFLWLGIGMALFTAQSLTLLVTGTDYFARAPLHALGIGFFGGMIVAMASRVTLGHSGRALEADDLTWRVLFGINLVAALRIAAEFAPAAASSILNVLAAVVWLLAFLLWARLYAPMYLRPRADGNPG